MRVGQSKVPYGFENLQSSSSRLPFDRNDALNSGTPNERDLGVAAMWSPREAQRRFDVLSDSGLKGTGDYGVVALAVTNGQTANQSERNDGRHVTLRVSYPFRLASGQFVEAGFRASSPPCRRAHRRGGGRSGRESALRRTSSSTPALARAE